MKKLFVIAVTFLLCAGFTGCSTIQENETGANLAVTYATLKIIDQDAERADKVCTLAGDAKTFFDDRRLPITEIEDLIRAKIDFKKLDAADALLVETLIALIVQKIDEAAEDGIVDEQTMLTASKVLGWVKSASC